MNHSLKSFGGKFLLRTFSWGVSAWPQTRRVFCLLTKKSKNDFVFDERCMKIEEVGKLSVTVRAWGILGATMNRSWKFLMTFWMFFATVSSECKGRFSLFCEKKTSFFFLLNRVHGSRGIFLLSYRKFIKTFFLCKFVSLLVRFHPGLSFCNFFQELDKHWKGKTSGDIILLLVVLGWKQLQREMKKSLDSWVHKKKCAFIQPSLSQHSKTSLNESCNYFRKESDLAKFKTFFAF